MLSGYPGHPQTIHNHGKQLLILYDHGCGRGYTLQSVPFSTTVMPLDATRKNTIYSPCQRKMGTESNMDMEVYSPFWRLYQHQTSLDEVLHIYLIIGWGPRPLKLASRLGSWTSWRLWLKSGPKVLGETSALRHKHICLVFLFEQKFLPFQATNRR